jgi:putative hydrolase of the HAD superfamily
LGSCSVSSSHDPNAVRIYVPDEDVSCPSRRAVDPSTSATPTPTPKLRPLVFGGKDRVRLGMNLPAEFVHNVFTNVRKPENVAGRIDLITHVFFDFFGTLVDYDPSVHPTHNAPFEFARAMGSEVTTAESVALWQRAWDELEADARRTGREFSMNQVAKRYWTFIGSPPLSIGAIENLIAAYLDAWTEDIRPSAYSLDCVKSLAIDYRLAIVSNTHDSAMVPRLLARFFPPNIFSHIVTSIDVGWRKPHPTIFQFALQVVGVSARSVVFVGDSWQADVEGPRSVGMSAVYVGKGPEQHRSVSLQELPDVIRSHK